MILLLLQILILLQLVILLLLLLYVCTNDTITNTAPTILVLVLTQVLLKQLIPPILLQLILLLQLLLLVSDYYSNWNCYYQYDLYYTNMLQLCYVICMCFWTNVQVLISKKLSCTFFSCHFMLLLHQNSKGNITLFTVLQLFDTFNRS